MRSKNTVLFDIRESLNSACEWRKRALATRDDRELGYALAMVQANLDAIEDWFTDLEEDLEDMIRKEEEE